MDNLGKAWKWSLWTAHGDIRRCVDALSCFALGLILAPEERSRGGPWKAPVIQFPGPWGAVDARGKRWIAVESWEGSGAAVGLGIGNPLVA